MTRREELMELSGQIINGMMSSDGTVVEKFLDRALHKTTAEIVVDIAEKILAEIDKKCL